VKSDSLRSPDRNNPADALSAPQETNMKLIYSLIAATALVSACAPGAAIDSDMERGLVGAALGYGAAKAVNGNGDRGAIIGGLAGVFCDDAGVCSRPRY
jgi:hypothetical protein